MDVLFEQQVAVDGEGRIARVLMTDRTDGDLATLDWPNAVTDAFGSVSAFRQVHGAEVVQVESPGQHQGAEADGAITRSRNAALAVRVADCVPVGFVSEDGAVGAAHAGWRGLQAGILEATVNSMVETGSATSSLTAIVGPSIGARCYEFGEADLDGLAQQFGAEVRSRTAEGGHALSMEAAVRSELDRLGVPRVVWANPCTSCDADRFWSWRARAEKSRQAMIVVVQ